MRQLSEHDAVFLHADSVRSNANVTLIHIYDQSTAPGGKVRFKHLLAHVESRLESLPVLRQKLRYVPLGLDAPYLVEDEDFNLQYHVRHIALPKPGDWRQFCIQAARVHARRLDLARPLWELYVIEGLDSFLDLPHGSFALLFKVHHAVIDLEHGSEITLRLHDASPVPPTPEPPEPWFPHAPPGDASLLARAFLHTLTSPFRLARPLTRALGTVVPAVWRLLGDLLERPDEVVSTRFNSVISPHRVFDTRRFLDLEVEEIRRLVPGATFDDVLLAVCGGGLRLYLGAQGELPGASLTAATPAAVAVAGAGAAESTPQSWLRIQLGTDIADPRARLRAIHAQTAPARAAGRSLSARELTDLAQYAPAPTLAVTSKVLSYASARLGRWAPLANCTVTGVPGPDVPLYLVGARLTYFSAIMPISDGMGLVYAVTRYDGKAVVSFTSCWEQLPDPEALAQAVRDSFQEYLALARAVRAARPPRPARSRRRRATG